MQASITSTTLQRYYFLNVCNIIGNKREVYSDCLQCTNCYEFDLQLWVFRVALYDILDLNLQ
jgi:hypothetical protein